MTSATSFASMLSPTLIPTWHTAPMRSTSRERCRGWCEWPSRRTQTDVLIISLMDVIQHHVLTLWTREFSLYLPLILSSHFLNTQSPSDLSCSSKNSVFKEVLTRIEGHPDCRNLPMISFLILPMQRITRLPLLMDVSPLKTYSSMSSGITSFSTLVCVTLNHSIIILTYLTSLSFFKWFYSSSVSCFLWHHIIHSLSLALLSSSSLPSSVSVSPETLGFMLEHSEAFGSWESLVSIHFFPQLSLGINILSLLIECGVHGCNESLWVFCACLCFMWESFHVVNECNWFAPLLPFVADNLSEDA